MSSAAAGSGEIAGGIRKQALIHRVRVAAGKALAACPVDQWPTLEGRIEDVHCHRDEGDLERAIVALMSFLLQHPDGADSVLDELHAFAKRLSLGPARECSIS